MNTKVILNLLASSSTVTSFISTLISTLGQINPAHTSINLTQRSIHTNHGRT